MQKQQLSLDATTRWPTTVSMDGARQLHDGLAVAWSSAVSAANGAGDRHAAARAAACAVSRVSGCAEEAVALSHRTGAPPVPLYCRAGKAEPLPCAVSIAHSSGRAVAAAVAADSGRRVGVDLEPAGALSPRLLRLFASRAERALGVDPTTLWTLKEAAWKALSCDATLPFHALTVAAIGATATPTYAVFALRDDVMPGSVFVWQPWPGWVAALVEVA